jgi:outer membrane protein OmpA-like peptidoglycan-associated protein
MTSADPVPGSVPGATVDERPDRRRGAALILACLLAGGLAACSPPDWGGEDEDDPRIQGAPSENETYPNLSRVPNEVPRPTPKSLRDSLMDGLVADRANARYSDEELTVESTAVPPAPPPPEGSPRVDITWETDRYLTAEEKAEIAAAEAAAAEAEAAAAKAEAEAEAAAQEAAEAEAEAAAQEAAEAEAAAQEAAEAEAAALEAAALEAEAQAVESTAAGGEAREEVEVIFETARVETGAPTEETVVEETIVEESVTEEALTEETVPVEAVTEGLPFENEAYVRTAIVGRLLATIEFAPGSSELNAGSEATLNEVLVQQEALGRRLELVGYADRPAQTDDPVEQRMADLSLSLDRASAVAAALADLGAGKDSLIVRAATSTGTWWFRTKVQVVEIFLEK